MGYARKLARAQLKKNPSIQASLQGINSLAKTLEPITKDLNEARYLLAAILEAQELSEAQFSGFRHAVISYLQKLGMPDVEAMITTLEQDYEKSNHADTTETAKQISNTGNG